MKQNEPPQTDEGFLERWSRRKQQARQEEITPGKAQVPDDTPDTIQADHVTESHQAEPPPPGDEDMPPLESLGPDSDVSPFFSPRVSEGLRKAALQRLFHQPEFNVTDGLDDYCKDYRHYKPLGDTVTADMRHRMDILKKRLEHLSDSPPGTAPTRHTAAVEQTSGRPQAHEKEDDNPDDNA